MGYYTKMGDLIEIFKKPVTVEHRVTFDYESMAYIFLTFALLIAFNAFINAKLK